MRTESIPWEQVKKILDDPEARRRLLDEEAQLEQLEREGRELRGDPPKSLTMEAEIRLNELRLATRMFHKNAQTLIPEATARKEFTKAIRVAHHIAKDAIEEWGQTDEDPTADE